MADRELSVVAGALPRNKKPKAAQIQDAIAKRWRLGDAPAPDQTALDVIPILEGWIRRLEREAGPDPAASQR